jgi:hypothetical protein
MGSGLQLLPSAMDAHTMYSTLHCTTELSSTGASGSSGSLSRAQSPSRSLCLALYLWMCGYSCFPKHSLFVHDNL